MLGKCLFVVLAIACFGWAESSLAQPATPTTPAALAADEPAAPPASAVAPQAAGPIAATINGKPIYVAEVEGPFEAMEKAGRLGKEDPRLIKARMLSQIIDRRLADQVLLTDKTLYTEEEVESQLKQLQEAAEKQGTTLAQVAAAQGFSIEKLRQDLAFRIATQRYVQKQYPTVLPEFIEQHKAEFDGTEIRASHIILRPAGYNESFATLKTRAKAIREEIAAGKIDFATAAKKYSHGPSRERGGDIGNVPRHGVMLEPFSAALFQLKPGEISQPVSTALGVHLIQAQEVKPGTKDLKESGQKIQQLAATEILQRLLSGLRSRAKIEFTGELPYFKPGTEELATP